MKAAADGLVPDGKEAAFVKFGDTATYMPMVAGILKKVRNSGELSTIDAQVVHKNDKFTYRPGIDEVPVFEPNWFGDRGDAIGVYAVARTKDGGAYVEIMNKTQIDAIKNVARTKTVWGGPFAFEMWRKSVIRRLAKRLPSSTDLEQMIERIDEEIEIPKEDPKPVEEAKPTSSRLAKVVEAQTEKPKPEADPKPTMGEPDESPFNDELPI
jgi:recombination protein RecT